MSMFTLEQDIFIFIFYIQSGTQNGDSSELIIWSRLLDNSILIFQKNIDYNCIKFD